MAITDAMDEGGRTRQRASFYWAHAEGGYGTAAAVVGSPSDAADIVPASEVATFMSSRVMTVSSREQLETASRQTLRKRIGAKGSGGTAPHRFPRSAMATQIAIPPKDEHTAIPEDCCLVRHRTPTHMVAGADSLRPGGNPDVAIARTGFEPLTYSVPEAARLLGINRNTAYELAARGELPTIRLGKRIVVVRAGLQRLLESADGSCS